MPQAYCYLSQKIIDQLEVIKEKKGHRSTSQTMKELIELVIETYRQNEEKPELSNHEKIRLEKEDELNRQHTTHLLRLLALNADIFRCVFDKNKLLEGAFTAEDHIAELKKKVYNFIDGYVNN